MAQNWLQKLINPKLAPVEKARVWEQDIRGAGLPLTQDPSIGELMGPQYKGTITPDMAGRIFAGTPVVRACADIIANYGSSVSLCTYRRSGQKSKWRSEETAYPAPVLKWINRKLTPVDYIARLCYFLSLYENAYIAIEPSSDEDAKYSDFSLYPMNPRWVTIIPDPIKGVRYIKYEVNGAEAIYFRENNVMHIPGFSPFDDFYGLLKLNSLDYDIQKERHAKKYLTRFYNNAATFSGVLTIAGEREEELQKIRTQIEEDYRGGNKAFRILVLEEGQSYEQTQSSGIEVNSLPIIKDTNEMVQMVFGVPIGLLSGDVTDLETVEELFWNRTITPMLQRIEQMHTKKLCLPISTNLKMEFDTRGVLALKRQKLNLAKIHVAYKNSSIITANEVREELSIDPYNGENPESADMLQTVWDNKNAMAQQAVNLASKPGGNPGQSGGSSPSMSLPGSMGGRDQSDNGEAQLVDESGKKALTVGMDYLDALWKELSEPKALDI